MQRQPGGSEFFARPVGSIRARTFVDMPSEHGVAGAKVKPIDDGVEEPEVR
jgi:hypothetical protein